MQLNASGVNIPLDKDGFLKNLSDWDHQVAEALAQNESISLSKEHWEIINLIREFYKEFELSPAMRPLSQYIKRHLGAEKSKSIYLLQLFPDSPAKISAKIAGLPKPDNCL